MLSGIAILALLALLALVFELGRLYIVKTELQNAADACALAAARELSGVSLNAAANQRVKQAALASGQTVSALNRVNFQSAPVESAAITFGAAADAVNSSDVSPDTRYVKCVTSADIGRFVLVTSIPDINGSAVARLGPSQSHCALPLAVCAKPGWKPSTGAESEPCTQSTHPCWGLAVGEWVSGREGSGPSPSPGIRNWIMFSQHGTARVREVLFGEGQCDVSAYQDWVYADPGGRQGAEPEWNSRFGVYAPRLRDWKASCQPGMPKGCPDFTGYPYCAANWPVGNDAYGNFESKRVSNAPYTEDVPACMSLGGNQTIAASSELRDYGADRRVAILPVVDCATWRDNNSPGGAHAPVLGWACGLMLAPIAGPDDVSIEFLGRASDPRCTTTGMPGPPGATGGLVPTLVR